MIIQKEKIIEMIIIDEGKAKVTEKNVEAKANECKRQANECKRQANECKRQANECKRQANASKRKMLFIFLQLIKRNG